MADAIAIIRAQLGAVAGITALVGDRIGPEPLPQGDTLPAILLAEISVSPYSHLNGSADLDQVRVQVTIKAASDAERTTLKALVRAALFTEDQILQESIEDYLQETKEFLAIQDYFVWVHPSA